MLKVCLNVILLFMPVLYIAIFLYLFLSYFPASVTFCLSWGSYQIQPVCLTKVEVKFACILPSQIHSWDYAGYVVVQASFELLCIDMNSFGNLENSLSTQL